MTDKMRTLIEQEKRTESARKDKIELQAEVIPLTARDGGAISAHFYKSPREGTSPTMFDIHGGGFVWGDAILDHTYCERIRDDLGMNVISIQYRLAPDYPYPGQAEDCYDVIRYFYKNADIYGIDKDRCVVNGFSSGGNLAAIVCMMAKDSKEIEFALQVLIYPYLDLATNPKCKPGAAEAVPEDFPDLLAGFNDLYAKDDQRSLKYVSPVRASIDDLAGLPSAIIITGEKDLLCAEGQQYAALLKQAGVVVHSDTISGAYHGFMDAGLDLDYLGMIMPPDTPQAYKDILVGMANYGMEFIEKQLELGLAITR